MPKQPTAFDLAAIAPDPSVSKSLYEQLYDNLRSAVLSRRLAPGLRLPSTRLLAMELGLSRNTVVTAFEQLVAEGYLESRTGDGTYVSRALPDELLTTRAKKSADAASRMHSIAPLSKSSQAVAEADLGTWRTDGQPRAFRPDLLALDQFPTQLWLRSLNRRWRTAATHLLGYGEPLGYRPLREAIAEYLSAARGVYCSWEQVLVTTGAQQGIDLAVRTLLDPGDQVWLENPGYRGIRGALTAVGAALVPVSVDEEGLQVEEGLRLAPQARAVYVTPSHQYPTGVTMSLARRLALLAWAQRANAWVVEDDYDSEYRYNGRPLSALQGLDSAQRVIYVGTFSKVLFPALRLGYLVVPPALVESFARTRALTDRQSPTVEQAALADFIEAGHFVRHIRRMRQLYAERQAILVDEVRRGLNDCLSIAAADAGLHVVGWLPAGADDRKVAQILLAYGIEAPAVSNFALAPLPRGGLMLGYAALTPEQIRVGVARMKEGVGVEKKRLGD